MQRVLASFDRLTEAVAMLLIVSLLVCVTLGIVTRAMGDPLIWTDELSRFQMLWLAVFGWIIASRRNGHIRIRYFLGLMPHGLRRGFELLIQFGLLVFGATVAFYGVRLTATNVDMEATTVSISMSWFYAPVVLAGVITALQAALDLGAAWSGASAGPGRPV